MLDGKLVLIDEHGKPMEMKVMNKASSSKSSTSMEDQLVESNVDEVNLHDDETSRYITKEPRKKSVHRPSDGPNSDRASTSKDTTTNAATSSTSSEHGNSDGTNLVTIKNSFEALKENENIFEKVVSSREDNVWDTIKEAEQVMEESDSDEVEDV
ncbi:hypothetical protein Tco_0512636 [Tanacetum coccineum]